MFHFRFLFIRFVMYGIVLCWYLLVLQNVGLKIGFPFFLGFLLGMGWVNHLNDGGD